MQSYDPPPTSDVTDGLTAEQASAAVNQMNAAFVADKDHPFYNGAHPQHKDFVDYSTRLYTIMATAKADAQDVRDAEELEALLSGRTEKQQVVQREAEREVEILRKLGFEGAAPAVCQPHQLAALKMQRLNAQGDVENLAPVMERELCSLKAPAETLEAFRSYVNVPNLDPELREGIFEKLIAWIHAANTQRYGNPKPSTPEDMEDDDNELL